ncbi:MAG: hypothetical protein DWQ05_05670 [Calditrichaeota bacterium]|nr:MAG: hypothetical protein DWQ05_05670 [Calditrichota bacterium]
MRFRLQFFVFSLMLVLFACEKKESTPELSMLPPFMDEVFYFRGYVTDSNKELVSDIYNFTRQLVDKDTVDGKILSVYLSQGKRTPFYRDKNGTVYQKNTENIGLRVIPYGMSFLKPIEISYWQTMLKIDDGMESEWSLEVDTTFQVLAQNGKPQQIRYIHKGSAKYNGWTSTFIPAAKRAVEVLDAHWFDLQTHLINVTAGDTLYSSLGDAHYYFTEHFGAVKFIHDFVKKETGKPEVKLYSTWEHVSRFEK